MNTTALVTMTLAGQLWSALCWLIVAWHFIPSLRRVAAGRALSWDPAGSWITIAGAVQTGFTIRWLVFGRADMAGMSALSLQVWAPLYLMNGACALGMLYTFRNTDFIAARGRARQGVAVWAALALLCVGATWLAL